MAPRPPASTPEPVPDADRAAPVTRIPPPPEGSSPQRALSKETGGEVIDDGQEQVFSLTAVRLGVVQDPKALGPEDLVKAPRSPGNLASPQPRAS